MVQIGFSTSNMFLSRMIRLFTKAKYSHCWFLFEHDGKKFIFQADMGGVQIDPYEKFAAKWTNITLITPKQPISLDPAWDLLATNYGYAVLLGDLWVILGTWLKQKWKNPFYDAHSLVCSQFVLDVLRDSRNNYPGLTMDNVSTIVPQVIYDQVTK